ncbi:MAG: ATP-binding cassette domain-containing protein [Pseudomonadota bacterium]
MLSVSKIKVQRGGFHLNIDELKFERGSLNILIGPNGSGKTTFLKSVAGILDYTGNVSIEDKK